MLIYGCMFYFTAIQKKGICKASPFFLYLNSALFSFQVLFRYALSVFKSSEEQLLKCADHMSIFNSMRQIPEKLTDANSLTQVRIQDVFLIVYLLTIAAFDPGNRSW